MASLNSGSSEKGQELLDLSLELPARGYDIRDLQRNTHTCVIQASVEEPNTGLRMDLSIESPGRLDHALEFLIVCIGAVVSTAAAVVICDITGASAETTLWIAGAVAALVVVGGLAWVIVRKK